MASVIIGAVAGQVIEESAEESIELLAEKTIEPAVEVSEEESIYESAESVVSGAVRQQVEEQAEQVVDNTVEYNVECAVENAEEGYWKTIFKDKILPTMIAGLAVGMVLLGINKAIEASNKDKGTDKSKETNDGQKAAVSVLEVVNEVCTRWIAKLKEYQKSGEDLGTFKFNGKDKDASKTIGALVTSMHTELDAAKDIAVNNTANKSWNVNIDQFKWRVANACEDLLAVFEVKKTGENLTALDFPPASDETAITDILGKEMPNYKTIIYAKVKTHLSSAVTSLAKTNATRAVKALISKPLTTKIKSAFNTEIRPDVLASAKAAATAETTVVMNSYMSDINKHVAIPVYGLATLKSWMEHHVAPTAKKEATKRALDAANATLKLPPAQIKMMNISKTARAEVMEEYGEKVKEAAKQAAKKVIKKAIK